jgi:hypothetical protein
MIAIIPLHMWRLNFKTETDMKLQCCGVHTPTNKLTSLRKRKINSSKEHSKMMERISNCQTIDRRLKNSSLISEMY